MADAAVDNEVPRNPVLKYGAYAAALAAIAGVIAGVWSMIGNDMPPMASISRVEGVRSEMVAGDAKSTENFKQVLGILNGNAVTMLQIQLRSCQRDRLYYAGDLQKNPGSTTAQEALNEANDCIRSLSRQINKQLP